MSQQISKKKPKSSRTEDRYAREYQTPNHGMLRPFRAILRWWHHWQFGSLFFHSLYRLRKSFGRVVTFRGTSYEVEHDSASFVKTWPSASTIANPAWWFLWIIGFSWRWLVSRPYGPMMLALPGVVAIAAMVAISSRGGSISRGNQAAQYQRMLATAASENDLPRARLLSDALLRLTPRNGKTSFVRALVELENGNRAAAVRMMEEIAVHEESAQAALWLAHDVRIPEIPFQDWPQETKKKYFDWLMLAIRHDPHDPVPRRLLGDVFRMIGDLDKAYAVMKPVAETSNENACLVAYLESELGMNKAAHARAEGLEKKFRGLLRTNPTDSAARAQHAMLLLLLEREDDAIETLEAGLNFTTDPAQERNLYRAIAEAMVVQAKKIREQDPSPRGMMKSLEKLRQAMNVDPTNPNLIKTVSEVCLKAAESPDSDLVVLREAVVQGVSSDASHFILGTTCLMQGKIDEGNRHLEVALKNNPNLPGLLNNLAYAISMQENPDLERALRLANSAVAAMPESAYIRDTRGQILMEMERFSEAIADLELALATPELRPVVRPKLITAYEALGDELLAERHRQLLERGR